MEQNESVRNKTDVYFVPNAYVPAPWWIQSLTIQEA